MTRYVPPPPTRFGAVAAPRAAQAKAAAHAPPPTRYGGAASMAVPPLQAKRLAPPPGPPAPAAAAVRGVVQRFPGHNPRAAALNLEARTILWNDPDDQNSGKRFKGCQEVQVMSINGTFFISGNTDLDNKAIAETLGAKKLIGASSCADKAAASAGDRWVLAGGGGTWGSELHAEQNLLRIVYEMISNGTIGQVQGPIEVWGTKPPCNACANVLQAFANTLYERYGVHLLFQGRSFAEMQEAHPVDAAWDQIAAFEDPVHGGILLEQGRKHVETKSVAFGGDFGREFSEREKAVKAHKTLRQYRLDLEQEAEERRQAQERTRQMDAERQQLRRRNKSTPSGQQASGGHHASQTVSSQRKPPVTTQSKSQCQGIALTVLALVSFGIGAYVWATTPKG